MLLAVLRRSQKGDTIVEVLIAIAVISSVVGTAYAITNRNVQTNQQSQERSRAIKVAETQFELLKTWAEDSANSPSAHSVEKFCLYTDGGGIEMAQISTPVPSANNADYPVNCRFDSELYMVAIIHELGTELFTVHVDWDGPTGPRDQLSMTYKVYQ